MTINNETAHRAWKTERQAATFTPAETTRTFTIEAPAKKAPAKKAPAKKAPAKKAAK